MGTWYPHATGYIAFDTPIYFSVFWVLMTYPIKFWCDVTCIINLCITFINSLYKTATTLLDMEGYTCTHTLNFKLVELRCSMWNVLLHDFSRGERDHVCHARSGKVDRLMLVWNSPLQPRFLPHRTRLASPFLLSTVAGCSVVWLPVESHLTPTSSAPLQFLNRKWHGWSWLETCLVNSESVRLRPLA